MVLSLIIFGCIWLAADHIESVFWLALPYWKHESKD